MTELSDIHFDDVSGGGSLWYDIGHFWGSAFKGSGDWYPMADNYALGA